MRSVREELSPYGFTTPCECRNTRRRQFRHDIMEYLTLEEYKAGEYLYWESIEGCHVPVSLHRCILVNIINRIIFRTIRVIRRVGGNVGVDGRIRYRLADRWYFGHGCST